MYQLLALAALVAALSAVATTLLVNAWTARRAQSGDSGADVIRQLLTNRQLDQAGRLRLIDKLIAIGGTGSGMAIGP